MDTLSEPTLLVALIELLAGVALLAWAADEFVEGAARLAAAARISPVVVGAVIIGFGTSAPELLVSGVAAAGGNLELGLGNIVGSNVANLSLVLGVAAFFVPLVVSRTVLTREAPLSLLAVLLFAYTTSGGLTRLDGVILLVALVVALGWVVVGGLGVHETLHEEGPFAIGPEGRRTFIGLAGTVVGAQLLVWGAIAVAERLGVTGGFVGFTLVAVGTSLPELVTAVVAARKRETELIIGNLLGSNMFNSLAVGGLIAVLGPGPVDDEGLRTVGITVMVLVAVAAWFAMVTLRRVYRVEAVVLVAAWFAAVIALARTASTTA